MSMIRRAACPRCSSAIPSTKARATRRSSTTPPACWCQASAPVNYRKNCLPNYRVFDEKRYFTPGTQPDGGRAGRRAARHPHLRGHLGGRARARGARRRRRAAASCINASPYEQRKQREREAVLRERVAETGLPVVYVNLVGGQDELVFDGRSCVHRRAWRGRAARAGLRGSAAVHRRAARCGRRASMPRAAAPGCRWPRSWRPRKASTGRWCWACATTSTSTAFPAWSWACPAAWIRR